MNKCCNMVFVCITLCALSACSEKVVTPSEYVLWMDDPDNGLHIKKEMGEFFFESQYKTPDYIKFKELRDLKVSTRDSANLTTQFTFRIGSNERNSILKIRNGNIDDYYKKIAYLSFDIQNDFYLINGSDTLPCQLFHWVRNYELAPFTDFLLVFQPISQSVYGVKLVYDDKIFGTGKIIFNYDEHAINNSLSMKISNV